MIQDILEASHSVLCHSSVMSLNFHSHYYLVNSLADSVNPLAMCGFIHGEMSW